MAEMIKEPIENYGLSFKDRKKTLFSKIGIVGCGKEGSKIATVAATAGLEVVFLEINEAKINRAFDRIGSELDKRIVTWGLTESEKKSIIGRVTGTLSFSDFKDCDFVIEAVRYDENGERSLNHRKEIFRNLEEVVSEDTIIATNASSVVITELTSELKHKERCVCLHFVMMQPQSKVLEIVRGLYTSDACYNKVCQFAKLIGYDYVTVEDSAGLVCNRLFFILLNEACAILQEGLTSAIEIDSIMRFGLGQRQGVFCVADQMGIEKIVPQMEDLFKEFGSLKYKPSPLLIRLNRLKHWGVRTGKGFYSYDEKGNRIQTEKEKK